MSDEIKPNFPNEHVCEHGSLRRKCEICERDEEIAHLREQIGILQELYEQCKKERDEDNK